MMNNPDRKRAPTWLIGLGIAIVLFVALVFAAGLLGFGDDPVITPDDIDSSERPSSVKMWMAAG